MRHVIIGAGAAGITAAKTIRECDATADIVVIASDSQVHSRCMLHKYISHERDEKGLSFIPENFFEEQKITFVSNTEVTQIIPKENIIVLDGKNKILYDKLLIATGANSFIPPIGDFRTAKNVFGLRHLSDAQAIDAMVKPESKVLIVGSGLVGMDAACGLLERGISVTIVEMADRILPIQLDETAALPYQKLFEEHGCRFILGRKASQTIVDLQGNITQVMLDDGTAIDCDIIIVAAGVRPAMECIKDAGIVGERNIQVDESMKTNIENIYAAGDVAGLSGIWPNAQKQGQIAAYNMCGFKMQYIDRYAMKNTINFYGLVTLSLGRGTAQDVDQVYIEESSTVYKKAILRDGKLDSILLQGEIDYSGIYQYLIKNEIDLSDKANRIFDLSFADFYGIEKDGQYTY